MEWEKRREEDAKYYTAYAKELRDQLKSGLLAELRQYPNFVMYQSVRLKNRITKVPYNPNTHRRADPTNPKDAADTMTALRALTTGRYNGIGYILNGTPFTAIDLDGVAHHNRRIDYRGQQAIRHFNSYTEYSPSGTGLHILIKADVPNRKTQGLEVYSHDHYVTLTLKHVPETPFTIENRQAELDTLFQAITSPPTEHPTPTVVWEQKPPKITEVERSMIEHWKEEPGNFKRYFEGDESLWTGSEKIVNSKSEADFVLTLMLLSRTQDVEAVKRLFRASGLFDQNKTDRISGHDPNTHQPVTYLEMTIFNALKKRELKAGIK